MLARDIMRKKVVTVTPDATVQELTQLLLEKRITGAPVVDRKGQLVGVVSQTDLVRHDREEGCAAVPNYHVEPEEGLRAEGLHVENPDLTRVSEIMTPNAISFEEATPIRDLAKEMLRRHIHRVPITRKGALCGIVTSMDLLKALLELIDRHAKGFRLPVEKVV